MYNYYDPHCIQENDGAHFTKNHTVDSRAKMWTQSSKPVMVTNLIDCLSGLKTRVAETVDQMLTMIISHKWNDS